MKNNSDCRFCSNKFPITYQVISRKPSNWLVVHNIDPQTDFHCMVVLKKDVSRKSKSGHIESISDDNLPSVALNELGKVLNIASRAIMASSKDIDRVLLASLNTGKKSSHLHFHLIPKRKDEKLKTVHDPCKEGGGLFFLARKEIVVDTFDEYIGSTTGSKSNKIKRDLHKAKEAKVRSNVKLLRRHFNNIWNKSG